MEPVKKDGNPATAPGIDSAQLGRIYGSDATANENASHDISSIDKQEGNMENGALGGNFEKSANSDENANDSES